MCDGVEGMRTPPPLLPLAFSDDDEAVLHLPPPSSWPPPRRSPPSIPLRRCSAAPTAISKAWYRRAAWDMYNDSDGADTDYARSSAAAGETGVGAGTAHSALRMARAATTPVFPERVPAGCTIALDHPIHQAAKFQKRCNKRDFEYFSPRLKSLTTTTMMMITAMMSASKIIAAETRCSKRRKSYRIFKYKTNFI